MSLNINQARQSGFTIVELLIVVVVIAILAAITIVSYNGITAQANTSAAQSTASTLIKKAELYNSQEGAYPTYSQLTGGSSEKSWYVPSSTAEQEANEAALTTREDKTPKHIFFEQCGSPATGVEVHYYDYQNGSVESLITGSGCNEE